MDPGTRTLERHDPSATTLFPLNQIALNDFCTHEDLLGIQVP
jgi:hypothetical protein